MAMTSSDSESDVGAFGLSEDFVQSPSHKAASTKTVDFGGLLTPPLILHEDLAEGNGGQAWPAGMILTKYLLRRKRSDLQNGSMFVESRRTWSISSNAANASLVVSSLGPGVD